MAKKADLKTWIVEALRAHGGSASLLDICKHIWANHEEELRHSGDLFYTWQYDMRWAGHYLVREGKIVKGDERRGVWSLLAA